jgi:hypothetical protein
MSPKALALPSAMLVVPFFPSDGAARAWLKLHTPPPATIEVLDFRPFFGQTGSMGGLSRDVAMRVIRHLAPCHIAHFWAFNVANQDLLKSTLFAFTGLSIGAFHLSQNDKILESIPAFLDQIVRQGGMRRVVRCEGKQVVGGKDRDAYILQLLQAKTPGLLASILVAGNKREKGHAEWLDAATKASVPIILYMGSVFTSSSYLATGYAKAKADYQEQMTKQAGLYNGPLTLGHCLESARVVSKPLQRNPVTQGRSWAAVVQRAVREPEAALAEEETHSEISIRSSCASTTMLADASTDASAAGAASVDASTSDTASVDASAAGAASTDAKEPVQPLPVRTWAQLAQGLRAAPGGLSTRKA